MAATPQTFSRPSKRVGAIRKKYLDVFSSNAILSIMKESLLQAFGTADAAVIFFLGTFLSLLAALLARQMYRAQSLPVFSGITATMILAAVFFLSCLAEALLPSAREPQFTTTFLAAFSIFWLLVVISTSPIAAPSPPAAHKRFRIWMGALGLAMLVLFAQIIVNSMVPATIALDDVAMQIMLGTICGIFIVAAAISVFRLWRSRSAIWAWLALAALANTFAALVLYQPALFVDGGLVVFAGLAACPLFVILGLFADQARFVRLESELRRGLVENSYKFEEETRHLRAILATSREMVVHLDRDEHITHHTPSFLALLKGAAENCAGKKLNEVLPPEWLTELAPALQEAKRGRTFQADRSLRDGENKRLFQVHATALRDEKERVNGIHLSLIDLSEHGRREVTLETQAQMAATDLQTFRRIVELSTDAIYMTDARQQIVYANEATERLTGFTRSELLRQTPLQFRAPESAKTAHDEILRKLAQGKRYRGEINSRRKDGTLFLSQVTVVPLSQSGEAAQADGRHIWIENDATERQSLQKGLIESAAQVSAGAAALGESRRYHESLLDALRDFVFVFNQQGQCAFVNAAARQRLGYTADKVDLGKLPAVTHELLRLDKDYGDAMKAEIQNFEASIRARNGQAITCAWQARPLFDAKGERNGFIAIARDLAELKEMQSTLASYRHQVEEKVHERTAELQRRVDHLNRLLEIGDGVRLHADIDEVMQRLADSVVALGWQRVLAFTREASDLRLAASAGFAKKQRTMLGGVERVEYGKVALYFDERFRLSRSYFVDSSRVAASAALPYLPSAVSLPEENEWRRRDGVLVPIIQNEEITGLFVVFSPQDGKRPTEQNARDLEIIADDAAVAIANSRLLKSHRRQEHYARILSDIAETFQSTRTLEQIVADIAEVATRAFDCRVALAIRDVAIRAEENSSWFVVARPGTTAPAHTKDKELAAFVDELAAKKPVVIRRRREDLPVRIVEVNGKASGAKPQSSRGEVDVLVVPLFGRGQKIGFVAHYDAESRKGFSEADLEFARDLAERVALTYENAQLFFETEKKAQELELANQMVTDFLASTSHELRTPMQAILSMSDFLLRGLPGKLNDEQQRQIGIIQKSGRSLLALINDILDLSKIEAGKMEAAVDDFNLPSLLREAVETIEPLCREKNLRLRVEIAKNLPAQFAGDHTALMRVLTNLLGNAVKFTDRGDVQLKASLSKGNELEIIVRDTGIGIAPEHQKKIFEPFHQIESGSARRHGGTGLGLAISKRLVGLLGGTIEIESALGKGTTFLLRIPKGQKSQRPKSAVHPSKLETQKKKKSLLDQTTARMKGKPRILVVEDNENTRYAMQFLLENEGYLVDFADGGEQALLAAQHHKPQLILLDIMMPTMDGYQVSRMLKAQKQLSHIPVVALTARAMKGDRELALAAGCDDYLTKPFERKDILAVIERWLDNGGR
jgi:PAS domain S-box-containing protein